MKPSEIRAAILGLPLDQRAQEFARAFTGMAKLYVESRDLNDARGAQEAASGSLQILSALFADNEDPAHLLILSMIDAQITARSGSTDHILLRPGARIPGTKLGAARAQVAGIALGAVAVLCDQGLSANAARKFVSAVLTDRRMSARAGSHGVPLAVTSASLRNWADNPDNNPIATAMVAGVKKAIEAAIIANGCTTVADVKKLIADYVTAAMHERLAI